MVNYNRYHKYVISDLLYYGYSSMTDILNSMKSDEVKEESRSVEKNVEEFNTLDDILDKLSRNNYDRTCLTEKELKVLTEQK